MKTRSTSDQTRGGILPSAGATVLAVALMATLPQAAYAERPTPPPLPENIQVPAGNKVFLVGHAFGTQNYICLPSSTGFSWILFGPQATLFNDDDGQIMTHDFSPNPDENGTIRATWQHSRDTSAVWGRAVATSTDPAFVAPGAIAWLRIQVVGADNGPTGGDKLKATTFILRVNTAGGVAPATGCSESANVGSTAFMPYTTDYFFYKAARGHADDEN